MMPIKFDKKYLRENIVKPRLVKVVNTLQDYTSVSTIAGVCYFNRNSTAIEKIFWSICLILLLSLAGYNSWQAYAEWQNSPWITTMTSAAVPIKELPFPSVTFCSTGTPAKIYMNSFERRMLNFKIQNKIEEFKITNFYKFYQMVSAIESRMASNINVSETEISDIVDFNGLSCNFKINGTWAFSLLYPHFNNLNYIFNYFYMVYIYFLKIKNIEVYLIKDFDAVNIGAYFEENYRIEVQEIRDGKNDLEIEANEANYSGIFPEIIQHLWYSSTPCFDISDLTAEEDNESSFLRNCQWKGVTINCAAIFSTIPTDVGLCCGFNIMAAEEMFTTSKFTEMITFMQNYDKSLAFFSTDLPDWYLSNREPMSKVGKNMGLQVTLDAHSNIFDFASVETDFKSFELLISKSKDFPLTSEKSLPVSMGHHTLIALSGYILKADPSLHNVDANSKECLFPNEYGLKLFKSYYQSNCYFECTLKYVQTKLLVQTNSSRICTPWYFHLSMQMITFVILEKAKLCLTVCDHLFLKPNVMTVNQIVKLIIILKEFPRNP